MATQRNGRANKKRDDRSTLVEVWMLENMAHPEKPSNEVKEKFAKVGRVGSACQS
jgi:hypothetical protein